jgi:hypothetical protein
VTASAERAARNEVAFREVNERIADLIGAGTQVGTRLFVCECSRLGCAEALEITSEEYEAVREDGAHFVVAPGHQVDAVERVVERHARFIVVEKFGDARLTAVESDPRSA